jgi:hypothetical protein
VSKKFIRIFLGRTQKLVVGDQAVYKQKGVDENLILKTVFYFLFNGYREES